MNILYLDAARGLFGAGRMLATLLERMDRSKVSPYVVLARDWDGGDLRLATALRMARVPSLRHRLAVLPRNNHLDPMSILSLSGALLDSVVPAVRLIRKYRIDIVQSNTGTVLTGALAARIAGVPHIWHVHEIFSPGEARLFPPMLDAFSTCVVTVSEQAAQSLTGYRPAIAGKLRVIKNGIDPAPFRSVNPEEVERLRREWGIMQEERVVATVGQVGMGKGEDNFLRMAQMVRRQVGQVKFAIIGGAPDNRDYLLEEITSRADAMGIGGDVIVPGFRNDMPVIMNLIDLLVQLPDKPEPFGLPAAEAMAAGRPAIVAASGGLSEVVCDFETGYHVPPGHIREAAERVVELLANDSIRNHMGRAATRRVDREFSPERYIRQFEELYEEVSVRRKRKT